MSVLYGPSIMVAPVRPAHRTWHVWVFAARLLLPILALVLLAERLGAQAFRPALAVVAPVPLAAALALGGIATVAQAFRWRVVMTGAGVRLGRGEAVAESYRAGALNVVLPGGVVGDALRAWRQRTDAPHGWRVGVGSVVAERACGLCLLASVTAVMLIVVAPVTVAAIAAGVAGVAWAVARPSLRRLCRQDRLAVWSWSLLALAALVTLTVVTAATVDASVGRAATLVLGLAVLAGMAVPLNLGGWGPREAAGALAAMLVGAPAATGVAVAAGYGLLATVSVLPGYLVLISPRLTGTARRGPRPVELEYEFAGR
jgi:glycosyltransferase 2 family protein